MILLCGVEQARSGENAVPCSYRCPRPALSLKTYFSLQYLFDARTEFMIESVFIVIHRLKHRFQCLQFLPQTGSWSCENPRQSQPRCPRARGHLNSVPRPSSSTFLLHASQRPAPSACMLLAAQALDGMSNSLLFIGWIKALEMGSSEWGLGAMV